MDYIFLGMPDKKTEDWIKRMSDRKTLTVQEVWSHSSKNGKLFINGQEKQYGEAISMQPGEFTIKAVCNESAARFRRFSTEPEGTDHGAYEYETSMTFTDTTEISAFFSTEYS